MMRPPCPSSSSSRLALAPMMTTTTAMNLTVALLLLILSSPAVVAHQSSLPKRTAPFGTPLFAVDAALAADDSVLGWRSTNIQGTESSRECWDTSAATTQRLFFDSPVRRVDITWVVSSAGNKKKKNNNSKILNIVFTTASGARQVLGSSSSSSNTKLPKGLKLRRSSASASKGRALSGLYASACWKGGLGGGGGGGGGGGAPAPDSGVVVSYWSPVSADNWWPTTDCDGGGGGGGGNRDGGGCNGGGDSSPLTHDPTGAGLRLASLLPKDTYVAMFPMLTDWRCTGSLNVPQGADWPYRSCTTRLCPAGTQYSDWEFNEGKILTYSGKPVEPYAKGMYDWEALVAAAESFPSFLRSSSSTDNNKRELAAFLAQISHETTSGDPGTGGLCFREEGPGGECSVDGPCATWPPVGIVAGCCRPNETGVRLPMPRYCQDESRCTPGKKYYGRGPKQLSYEYNYIDFGAAVGLPELVHDPDMLLRDRLLPFKSALWFWVTAQGYKPSCSDVMQGAWVPTARDVAANRTVGFGTVTNIINGGVECPPAVKTITAQQASRIAYYKKYCEVLGVDPGDNLSCENSLNFNF